MIEHGHKSIVDALSKMSERGCENWVRNLSAVLLADRSTVRTSTGLTPYYFNYASEPVLPIELEVPTWRILPWNQVTFTPDLLLMRARQLQQRDEDLKQAVSHFQRIRLEGRERHDEKHGFGATQLAAQDDVLLHDTKREKDVSRKLAFKWLGSYRITETVTDKGTYLLEELDGTPLAGTFAGDQMKKFYTRQELRLGHQPDLDHNIVPIPEDLLALESNDALSELERVF